MIGSRLVITTPAADLSLLTEAERRAAAGVTGSTYDATLATMDLLAASMIMEECNIAIGSGGNPTLKQETLTETFRNVSAEYLVLARRHEVSITSVTVDDVALETSEYEVDPEEGVLRLLDDTQYVWWQATTVVVVYKAGFLTVPPALKGAASSVLQVLWSRSQRDPMVKMKEIDVTGVDRVRTDYWVGAIPGQSSPTALPDFVMTQLRRFRNAAVG